jgi:two-component sensor histidine kinase
VWTLVSSASAARRNIASIAVVRWQEMGGPPVEKPTRRGLGSRLLAKQTGLDAVSHDFAPDGVFCEIKINGARLVP